MRANCFVLRNSLQEKQLLTHSLDRWSAMKSGKCVRKLQLTSQAAHLCQDDSRGKTRSHGLGKCDQIAADGRVIDRQCSCLGPM